VNIFQSKI